MRSAQDEISGTRAIAHRFGFFMPFILLADSCAILRIHFSPIEIKTVNTRNIARVSVAEICDNVTTKVLIMASIQSPLMAKNRLSPHVVIASVVGREADLSASHGCCAPNSRQNWTSSR